MQTHTHTHTHRLYINYEACKHVKRFLSENKAEREKRKRNLFINAFYSF